VPSQLLAFFKVRTFLKSGDKQLHSGRLPLNLGALVSEMTPPTALQMLQTQIKKDFNKDMAAFAANVAIPQFESQLVRIPTIPIKTSNLSSNT